MPWLTGIYALCIQVNDELSPEDFIREAFEAGTITTITHEGREYRLGTSINMAALMEAV